MELDHLILPVNDVGRSVRFYESMLGFRSDGEDPPFTVLRVSERLTLQLAPWGTEGGMHLAFALPRDGFDAVLARLRDAGQPLGDAFDRVGQADGPGIENGARGPGASLYFFDPDRHLIEIRHYESDSSSSTSESPSPTS